MAIYYMTCKRNNEIGYWRECEAETLTGAKREATKQYKDGYVDGVMVIAIGDDLKERRTIIAGKKCDKASAKWTTI